MTPPTFFCSFMKEKYKSLFDSRPVESLVMETSSTEIATFDLVKIDLFSNVEKLGRATCV